MLLLRVAGLALPLISLATTGCGRKATPEDCQLIVDRNVELELRAMNVVDLEIVKRKQQEIRSTLEPALRDCVGRRISDSVIRCVQTAESVKSVEQCLN